MGLVGQPPAPVAFAEHRQVLGELIGRLSEINTHYTREENQLFPTSLDVLAGSEWIGVKEGEADIGFVWVQPDTQFCNNRSI